MKVWRWAGAVMLVGAATLGVVSAYGQQAGGKVEWKAFDKLKESFYQEMKTTTTQKMKVQGMEVTQTQEQTFWVEWTPTEKISDNKWKVDYKIIGVKMSIQIGGNIISYDSNTKESQPQNPLTDFFKALVGSKFRLTVTNDPKEGIRVVDVEKEDIDDFVKKLASTNEQLRPLLKNILGKDALKQMANPTFAAFPPKDKEFKDGITWTNNDVTLDMGPIGSYKTNYTYTVKDAGKGHVEVKADMSYNPPKGTDAQGLPFTIKSGNLKTTTATGNVTVDQKNGRIEEAKMDMKLTGQLTIDIAGMETQVDLDQDQKSSLKTFDKNPLTK
jgi:hypothetical protein